MKSNILEIRVSDLDASAECFLSDYGKVLETCYNFSAKLIGGTVYALVADFGVGGWAVSYTLTGRKDKYGGIDKGKIEVNGELADKKLLSSLACYVGEDGRVSKFFGIRNPSVYKLIKKGVCKTKNEKTADDIVDMFKLTSTRIHRPMRYISGEKFRASAAIGFANKKSLYCFPWMNVDMLYRIKGHIELLYKPLKESGAII